jgi:hypothetical protein
MLHHPSSFSRTETLEPEEAVVRLNKVALAWYQAGRFKECLVALEF